MEEAPGDNAAVLVAGALRLELELVRSEDAVAHQLILHGGSVSRRERLVERGLRLELTDEAKEVVTEAGWDPTYGARPLKRALQRLVENPLALRLLEGDFAEGDTVRVDAQNGELVFQKAGVAQPAAA